VARLPWLVGAGALAAFAWTRRDTHTPIGASSRPVPPTPQSLPGRWIWPVASWNGRAPAISDGFDSKRTGLPRHGGVDVMFPRQAGDPQKAGTPNGSKGGSFVMPDDTVAVAASDGVVYQALKIETGYCVVINHAPHRIATFYAHLERLLVEPKQTIKAGDPIGIIGGNPLDGEHLMHLHFEVWLGGPLDAIDPASLMNRWEVVADPRPSALIARNGGFTYRPIGARGEPYPQWVRDLKGKAGVYVIREAGEIVYVGSSRTQLYDTVTRHFQSWRRWKGFWRGQYGEGHDPGLTYKRDRVEVAVRITRASDALDEESRLIRRLHPRDNIIGQPIELDAVPF
jgi:hypothetical protein